MQGTDRFGSDNRIGNTAGSKSVDTGKSMPGSNTDNSQSVVMSNSRVEEGSTNKAYEKSAKSFRDKQEKDDREQKKNKLLYDQKFKQLMCDRVFLTPILKNIVPEYENLKLEEIEHLISPQGDVEVSPELYDSEDVGKGEETKTHYDVLVNCSLPGGETAYVDFFFDLEMQQRNNPGYKISKRGMYYCCRLISRQLKNLKNGSYSKLKKVYSVWVITQGFPADLENTIFNAKMSGDFINFGKSALLRYAKELNAQIDLLSLSLIYLNQKLENNEGQHNLIRYLQSMFNKQVGNPVYNPYAGYSKKREKEVDEVMSFSDVIEARGMEKGMERGGIFGRIKLLLELGNEDIDVINNLMNMDENPLSEERANEMLDEYYKYEVSKSRKS